jgi:L-lysine exporter family protein LysE/ArgO
MNYLSAAVTGFALGAGLIVAIGAQNAFVLRQGLLRANVPLVVGLAIAVDMTLILAGCLGLGGLIHAHPGVLKIVAWGGAAFVLAYGLLAFRRALQPGTLNPADAKPLSAAAAARTILAVSLLNPHVYVDTVGIVGSVAGQYAGIGRLFFAGGASAASVTWFCGLVFGARFLRPVFASHMAWRILDSVIGVVMLLIAASLARMALA